MVAAPTTRELRHSAVPAAGSYHSQGAFPIASTVTQPSVLKFSSSVPLSSLVLGN